MLPEKMIKIFCACGRKLCEAFLSRGMDAYAGDAASEGMPGGVPSFFSNATRFAGLAFEETAPCCAHNFHACGAEIPHLQGVKCFSRRMRCMGST